jgi:hypothetical protein
MKRQFVRFAPWVTLMVLGVIGTSRPANTEPQPERHPSIRGAIRELRNAEDYMRNAQHDFCGHRREAQRATGAAIRQLELALECARER